MMFKLEKITKRDENFAEWYTSVIQNAQLCVYGPIKGTIIYQPNVWSIWESIRTYLDHEFKKNGVQNLAMPILIPKSEFAKEKEHLKGFAPECFMVNQIGNKKLDDPYIIRPTSEILFCNYFAYVTSSYKNLPIKVNQWCSVMRAEKTTKPFLRNSEFHWQELHAIFADVKSGLTFTKKIIDIYEKMLNDFLCIPVIKGEKTIGERFAGAETTYTIEALMQDGQMLQCGTSHYLGQNFSKIYDIKFQNKNNTFDYAYQMSAGVSTRLLGAIIMVHGDDNGLVLPPALAPIQIKINVLGLEKEPQIKEYLESITTKLKKYRLKVDDTEHGLGYKLSEGEVQGIPIQIILGKETITDNQVTYIRRDNLQKLKCPLVNINQIIEKELEEYKKSIYQRAINQLQDSITWVNSVTELQQAVANKKIAKAYWAGTIDDEKKIKELTGASARCIIDTNAKESKCFLTKKKTTSVVIFGRAY